MPEQLTKWSVTSGTVVKHMHYGLRVQVPSGEIGVVDRAEIGDGHVDTADWPAVGSVVTVVGAGYAGRQLRLSTRPSHIEEARTRAEESRSARDDAK
jgi:predicted RNA-binding protein with RPS1 domain